MGAQAPAEVFLRRVTAPAYQAVSVAIERAIVDGSLPPGAALPTELPLAEQFGVHRSPVHEAIRQVAQEGLLQRREGRRLFVCLPQARSHNLQGHRATLDALHRRAADALPPSGRASTWSIFNGAWYGVGST